MSVVESMKERKALAVLEGGLVKVAAAGTALSEENKYPTQHAQHTAAAAAERGGQAAASRVG